MDPDYDLTQPRLFHPRFRRRFATGLGKLPYLPKVSSTYILYTRDIGQSVHFLGSRATVILV